MARGWLRIVAGRVVKVRIPELSEKLRILENLEKIKISCKSQKWKTENQILENFLKISKLKTKNETFENFLKFSKLKTKK